MATVDATNYNFNNLCTIYASLFINDEKMLFKAREENVFILEANGLHPRNWLLVLQQIEKIGFQ